MRTGKWLVTLLIAVSAGLSIGATEAAPENGWWWNAAESGRGFFIERQGGVLFMAGYFYEADGRGTWLVSTGDGSNPDAYTGRLLAVSGGQTLVGDYRTPTEIDVGATSLQFSDATHGVLTWPGGSIPIQRQRWNQEFSAFDPNGWWWNPDESGRGYSIEVQGDTLVMAAFMYDVAGKPVWYLSYGPLTTAGHYEGVWSEFRSGQTMGGAYREPTESTFGSVTINWTSADEATLVLSDETPSATAAAGAKKVKVIPIRRELERKPTPPPSAWPSVLTGAFAQRDDFKYDTASARETIRERYRGPVYWFAGSRDADGQHYDLYGTLNVDIESNLKSWPGLDPQTACLASFHEEGIRVGKANGRLVVRPDGTYSGWIVQDVTVIEHGSCQICPSDRECFNHETNATYDRSVSLDLEGVVDGNRLWGTEPVPLTYSYWSRFVHWDFAGQ